MIIAIKTIVEVLCLYLNIFKEKCLRSNNFVVRSNANILTRTTTTSVTSAQQPKPTVSEAATEVTDTAMAMAMVELVTA